MARDRRAVIIGAGITGTLSARALAREGWDVTILEAAHVGAGSSSRTAAGIRQQWSTADTVRGMRYAVRVYNEWVERTGADSIPIRANGYLFLAGDDAAWLAAQARVAMQKGVGLTDVEALASKELVERFPWIDGDTVKGGTFCPSDGFLLPSMIYQDGIADAKRHGARLISGAPVQAALSENGRVTALRTPKGDFSGDVYLNCTNAWTRALARDLGAEELPVDPLKRYLWFIKRDGPMSAETLAHMPLTITPSAAKVSPAATSRVMPGAISSALRHSATPSLPTTRPRGARWRCSAATPSSARTRITLSRKRPASRKNSSITAPSK